MLGCVCAGVCVPWCTRGDQKTLDKLLSPSTLTLVPGNVLRSPGLHGSVVPAEPSQQPRKPLKGRNGGAAQSYLSTNKK